MSDDWGFGNNGKQVKSAAPKGALLNTALLIVGAILAIGVYGVYKLMNSSAGIADSTGDILFNVAGAVGVALIATSLILITRARKRKERGY